MRTVWLVALGIVAYVAFALLLMPARFALAHGTLPPGLVLQEVRGTLFHGEARASLAAGGTPIPIDSLAWRFVPSRLLAGKMAYDVDANAPGLQAHARLQHGFGGLSADDVSARGDAALAAAISPLAAAWQPQGAVTLTAPHLAWNEREIVGEAQAEWRGARVALPQPRALGSYRAALEGHGGPARLVVTTLDGDYAVRGEGTLTPQRFEIHGQAGGQEFAFRWP